MSPRIPPITNSGLDLRDYQHKLKVEIFQAWRNGAKDVCAVSATGSGKTRTSGSVVHEFSNAGIPAMIAAHRQELVGQLSCAMAAEGVYHNIIASKATIRLVSNMHVSRFGRSYFHPEAPAIVSSVDTLIRRDVSSFADKIGLYVTDECFPAWVKVDGRPICDIKVGDHVTAFNEETGEAEPRKVVRLFKNIAPKHMVRLEAESHHVIHCTGGHPIFTRRGWVNAIDLTTDDEVLIDAHMYELWERSPNSKGVAAVPVETDRSDILSTLLRDAAPGQESETYGISCPGSTVFHMRGPGQVDQGCEEAREGLLQQDVLDQVSGKDFVGDHGEDESSVRIGANDKQEPYETCRGAREGVADTQGDRSCPETTRGQRAARDRSRDEASRDVLRVRVQAADNREDKGEWVGFDMPGSLQSGLRQLEAQDRDRGGRAEPHVSSQERAGLPQGYRLVYVRLGSVQVYERGDLARLEEGVCDGHVYNIEVEGLHTYIANGVVVHNCHHLLVSNKWGKCRSLFPNALGLGVTATPDRSDGGGLGRHADGFFDVLVQGPPMRDLIRQGYLTDYRIFCPPPSIDLSNIAVTASGDYSRDQLKTASAKSTIVGDVIGHYKRIAMGKRGVTFVVSVEDAENTAEAFNAAGVPAKVLTGLNTDAERAEVIGQLERGEILQIVAVDIISEGFDLPAIEAISFARPTQSYSLYIQMFGRALRPSPGKQTALILDHVGNVERFIAKGRGLPDTPQKWSLDRRERGAKNAQPDDVITLTTCLAEGCYAAYDSTLSACPWCGASPEPSEGGRGGPEQVSGELYEMDPGLMAQLRGEADAIMHPEYPEKIRQDMLAKHAPSVGVHTAVKRAGMQQAAQAELRGRMARWMSVWERAGLPVQDVRGMFKQVFGVDYLTAQTLPAKGAEELAGRLDASLREYGA